MTTESRTGRRARLLAGGVLVATFVAGALVGVASQRLLNADEPEAAEVRRSRIRPGQMFGPDGVLTRRLELTDAQRREIEALLESDRRKTDSMFREIRPRLRARYDSTTAGIRAVLDPEQQEEFDRYRRERRERMRIRIRHDEEARHDGRR
jgi:Spy/CpxP family protein refolding chaperone